MLSQAAAELGASLPDQRIEVRLVGGGAELVLAREALGEPSEVEPEGEADARITLRLSAQLKARVELAAARDGVSVNTFIVRALGQHAHGPSDRGPRLGRRLSGYGRS
jgi:hypothetical protein